MQQSTKIILEIEEFDTLSAAIESVISLYGRSRIAPYPHEHLAWKSCREAAELIERICQRNRITRKE